MSNYLRYKIETVEIEIGATTYKYISSNLPHQILTRYYGYKPYIKQATDISTEIKEKDTIPRRLKITFVDDFVITNDPNYSSYWRTWIAANKNYKGKLLTFSRRIGSL